jgi:hypothetical protein
MDISGYSFNAMFDANMTAFQVAETVVAGFRRLLSPTVLTKPFVWAKLGQGSVAFHMNTLLPAYDTNLDTLKLVFADASALYIFEEGWEHPENDNPQWRHQISNRISDSLQEEIEDVWQDDDVEDDTPTKRCPGCHTGYAQRVYSQHTKLCSSFQRMTGQTGGPKDARSSLPPRPLPKGKQRAHPVAPPSQPVVKEEPMEVEISTPYPRGSSPINLSSDPDAPAPLVRPKRNPMKMLKQLAAYPQFGPAWLEEQVQRFERRTTPLSTARSEASPLVTDRSGQEPLFVGDYSYDEPVTSEDRDAEARRMFNALFDVDSLNRENEAHVEDVQPGSIPPANNGESCCGGRIITELSIWSSRRTGSNDIFPFSSGCPGC